MNAEIFRNINKIIERDNKTSTYKFALLRGVIDIIQSNSPYIKIEGARAILPMGLLIENWIFYYYPILESESKIPQIYGKNTKLAFEDELLNLIKLYRPIGGMSAFYNDLKNLGIPKNKDIEEAFQRLVKKMKTTITTMPMKYLGKSLFNYEYPIFKPLKLEVKNRGGVCDSMSLVAYAGSFSIPLDYYETFRFLGSFITGQHALLFKWAEFSHQASGQTLSKEEIYESMGQYPVTDRNVAESKRIYTELLAQKQHVYCVWTGKKIAKFDVDHVIPYSVWKNNDLWNLLPSDATVNSQKRDKIPEPELLERRRDLIFEYWDLVRESQETRFNKEVQYALLGSESADWKNQALQQIQNNCDYLIETRGLSAWTI